MVKSNRLYKKTFERPNVDVSDEKYLFCFYISFQRLLCYGNAVFKYLLDHHQAKLLAALNIFVLYAAVPDWGAALFAKLLHG